MNYTTLKAQIAAHMHRTDLTSLIPTFVEFAEARFNRELRTFEMQESTSGSGTSITLPSDFLGVKTLTVAGKTCQYLAPEEFDRWKGQGASPSPHVYTIRDGAIEILPAASTDYVLYYYEKIPALSDSNTTNWLIDSHPDIYLYASMVEARLYVRDAEAVAGWEAKLSQSLAQLQRSSTRKTYGASMAVRVEM